MTTNTQKYFNSTFEFSGYINRARVVTPKKGNPYVAVSLCALSGSVEEPNKTYIDAIVSGAEAQKIVKEIQNTINSKDVSVFGRFRVSDLTLSTYQNAKNETVPIAKGRLLLITYLKTSDDSYIHQRGSEEDNQSSNSTSVSDTEASSNEEDSMPQAATDVNVDDSSEIEVTHASVDQMTQKEKDAMLKALLAQQVAK